LPHYETSAYQIGVGRPVEMGKIHQHGNFQGRGVAQRTNHGKTQPNIAVCRKTEERVANIGLGKTKTRRPGLRCHVFAIRIEIGQNQS
jgi:hypothetical protein